MKVVSLKLYTNITPKSSIEEIYLEYMGLFVKKQSNAGLYWRVLRTA